MKSMLKWKGFVGKGWEPIVEQAIAGIEAKGGFIVQVKEKFGGLRIYYSGGDMDAIDDVITNAYRAAASTCEECGNNGTLRTIQGVAKTLCGPCNTDLARG